MIIYNMEEKMDVLVKLEKVFRDVFDDETIVINRDTTAYDIEDWDSLMQMQLIMSSEAVFGIKFTAKDVIGLKNVGDFVDCISAKLNS